MVWNQIVGIVITCIASVGGIGVVIVAITKWTSDIIADRLSKKYQLILDKEIEKYKTELNKKEYMSKTRFETELRIYQELSEKNISMVYSAGEAAVIAYGAEYSEDEIERFLNRFQDQLNDAEMTNKKNAPFVEKDVYEKYLSLEKKATEIFRLIQAWKMYNNTTNAVFSIAGTKYCSQVDVKDAIIEKQEILSDDSNALLDDLRSYLRNLEVIE